jgi:hypothetical protein
LLVTGYGRAGPAAVHDVLFVRTGADGGAVLDTTMVEQADTMESSPGENTGVCVFLVRAGQQPGLGRVVFHTEAHPI